MVYIQTNGLQLPLNAAAPKHTVYIYGPNIKFHDVVDDASTKTADIVIMKVTTYADGVEDAGAEATAAMGVQEIKAAGTGANGVPYLNDYTYESTEEGIFLLLTPGVAHWARCTEATTTLAINSLLKGAAAGLVQAMGSGITTTGNIDTWRALQTRNPSATESFIAVEYIGKTFHDTTH